MLPPYWVTPALAWSFASPFDQPHAIAFGSVRLRSWFIIPTWAADVESGVTRNVGSGVTEVVRAP